jgi:ArsR family transcriptional regulator, arsenate/arsenite/antimonite-responsive transcriptional repressor
VTIETVPEVKALKALGDETRIRAVLALRDNELCVCQIVELLELAPSTVSKHLQILKEAGLVESRKKGRWVYYSLSGSDAKGVPNAALNLILDTARHTRLAKADKQRLKGILKCDPEELCERQNRC